ncbi:unnamed protein product [Camellia sinensis]
MERNNNNRRGRTVMEIGADGVAIITIINLPINSLSLDEIDGALVTSHKGWR